MNDGRRLIRDESPRVPALLDNVVWHHIEPNVAAGIMPDELTRRTKGWALSP
jgi:hypothetical protein